MDRRMLKVRKFLLRRVLPILRLFPLPFASRVVAGIGRTEYRMHKDLRDGFQNAVSRTNEVLGCDWDIDNVSQELAGNQIWWRTRDLLLDVAKNERVDPMFVVSGRSTLEAAKARGRGVILLTSHYGAHLLPSHWLARQDYPLRFYMERPRHVSKFLERQFQSEGPLAQDRLFISRKGDATGSAGSILRAAKALKAGMLLYVAGDVRWTGPNTQSARFLGHRYQFSATWVRLAAMTGAPVVPVFCHMMPQGTYHLEFLTPLEIADCGDDANLTEHWVQAFLTLLEDQVRLHPANSNEYFFWPEMDLQVA
ncbi:lysophospholipid acyltransferase family protein [Singulisphaera sp. PoT]|uniref:lysophospholipid acyltransferase family protein n=1 Tax=Singulisphaera sp. PoT TaxID=3411797 RepID=UPI003BF61805